MYIILIWKGTDLGKYKTALSSRDFHNKHGNTTDSNNNYCAIIDSTWINGGVLAKWWYYLGQARDVPHILVRTEKHEHLKVRTELAASCGVRTTLHCVRRCSQVINVGRTTASNDVYVTFWVSPTEWPGQLSCLGDSYACDRSCAAVRQTAAPRNVSAQWF